MHVFGTILIKLIPLYILIGLGFIAGKFLHVKKESIAPLVIYIMAPVIVFNAALTSPITPGVLALPVLIYLIGCALAIAFYRIGRMLWKDTTANILGFTAGDGNTGYFGIPIAIALFDQALVNIYILGTLGLHLFENSLGFFVVAKGRHTAKESLIKLLKLPTLYAFVIGLAMNAMKFSLGPLYTDMAVNFRTSYALLGMMLIGLALADIKKFSVDFRFISLAFLAKFVAWPLLMGLIIVINSSLLHLFDPRFYNVMMLLSIVPLAGNTVAFATYFESQPEKASLAVLGSTLFSLVYIPYMIWLVFGLG